MDFDRIENRRFEKNIRFFKWSAIITFVLAVIKVIAFPEVLEEKGKTGDFFLLLLPIALYMNYRRTAKNWGGQYIEWTKDNISFKTRNHSSTIIEIRKISKIDIEFDVIKIYTSKKQFKISIEDYTNYEDRIRIKDNFESLRKELFSMDENPT